MVNCIFSLERFRPATKQLRHVPRAVRHNLFYSLNLFAPSGPGVDQSFQILDATHRDLDKNVVAILNYQSFAPIRASVITIYHLEKVMTDGG